jgi:hypothetical protein
MTNFQAFCKGFWSAWDFACPFSLKQDLFPPEEKFDIQVERERLGLNRGYWVAVGDYLRGAMSNYENEVNGNVAKK